MAWPKVNAMQVTETKEITRELHVAPCLKCGSSAIKLNDYGYWEGNAGGGTCAECGHSVEKPCGPDPVIDALANIWNSGNDLATLIQAENTKIEEATLRKRGYLAVAASRGVVIPEQVYDIQVCDSAAKKNLATS